MRAFLVLMIWLAMAVPACGENLTIATPAPEWREASVGRPWMLRLEANEAAGTLEWAVADGMLPPGVHLVDASMVLLGAQPSPVLYGAPADAGEYWVLLRAADGEGRTAETWMQIRVSLLRLRAASAMVKVGEAFEWWPEVEEGVAPFTVKAAEEAFLPLGLTLTDEGVLRGEAKIAGRYEVPVEITDAGGNTLKTTLEVTVYGAETTLPPVGVRLRREGCKVAAEWTALPEGIEVKAFGGEGDVPLEIEVTNAETGERVTGVYAAPGPCEAQPESGPQG
jgi:hypothetical protein